MTHLRSGTFFPILSYRLRDSRLTMFQLRGFYLKAHGTEELLVAGLLALGILGTSGGMETTPVRDTIVSCR